MIKINLTLGKRLAGAHQEPTREVTVFGISLKKINIESLKDFPLQKIFVPFLFYFILDNFFDFYKSRELAELEKIYNNSKAVVSKWQVDLKKFEEYDSIKKQLDADQDAIKNKLTIIKQLVTNRSKAADVLVSLSNVIPSGVWLKEINLTTRPDAQDSDFEMMGNSLEYSQISDFMKNMTESRLFKNVELKSAEQGKAKDSNASIQVFKLSCVIR